MAQLVNTVPGGTISPSGPIQAGLRPSALNKFIQPGLTRVSFSTTNIEYRETAPEFDEVLAERGATIVLGTPERVQPSTGSVGINAGNSLKFTQTQAGESPYGIYEISYPIEKTASIMGYVKIRKSAWAGVNPFWSDLTNMSGVYLGLEHGTFNTAVHAFLRNTGSIVIGGPLRNFRSARPGQREVSSFNWTSVANGEEIELWLIFNITGYPPPFTPHFTPIFEVWAKGPHDEHPTILAQLPVGVLGTYPAEGAYNMRPGPRDEARLFVGFAGALGASLEVVDWALYPDYQTVVDLGQGTPGNQLTMVPDCPIEYRAGSNQLPEASIPSHWDHIAGSPKNELYFQGFRSTKATHLSIKKNGSGLLGYLRNEPIIGLLEEGFSVEALLSGIDGGDEASVGMGFSVMDGVRDYSVEMATVAGRRTFALRTSSSLETPLDSDGQVFSIDYQSPHLVRMIGDRNRGVVGLYVDGEEKLSVPMDSFPLSPAEPSVFFGHLTTDVSVAEFRLNHIHYLPRYMAWEGSDEETPDDAGLFVLQSGGSGSSTISNGTLKISKTQTGGGTERAYARELLLPDVAGFEVEFKARVQSYADATGRTFGPRSSTGAGVDVFLGKSRVSVRFLDCGIHGRKVAIIPAGGEDEVLDQTALGRKYSVDVDWVESQTYRLVYKSFDRIELWIGNQIADPALVIPYEGGSFGLPEDRFSQAIEFGHIGEGTTSTTEWEFFRWGFSNGFEMSVQKDSQAPKKHELGGRAFVQIQAEEE